MTIGLTNNDLKLTKKDKHAIIEGALDRKTLDLMFPQMKALWKPHPVVYNSGVTWSNSCYLDADPNMKPSPEPDLELRELFNPILEQCDKHFSSWYESCYGVGSVPKLTRKQTFITKYRPISGENQLARHVDGTNIDGSVILGLPTDDPYEGGGLTVWDGQPQYKIDYPVNIGDMVLLDRLVWHQGNPITSGHRYVLVIFYTVREADPALSRFGATLKSILKSMKWIESTGVHGMQLQGGDKYSELMGNKDDQEKKSK
eukprot:NODE_5677_length_984_cov_27.943089_g5098_i0.p1 GENE.NODE_5677_length_984_cov_27.943089_g5098_i0~~NODE_5677_length_984_cov_27.943089_g5098_i0.p1  ORF type:complete len:275 (-),score=38.66 NODE_5677_length_984_cov_27.943089_g5098_i0:159-932(-)